MNRYEDILQRLFTLLEGKAHGFYKRNAYHHLIQTATLAMVLAKKRQLDVPLCGIIGLLHDLSIPLDMNTFNHANRSSEAANRLLDESGLFSDEEKKLILAAIAHHSSKELIQDPYSELIKDADVWAHLLEGQVLKGADAARLKNIVDENGHSLL